MGKMKQKWLERYDGLFNSFRAGLIDEQQLRYELYTLGFHEDEEVEDHISAAKEGTDGSEKE